MEPDNLYIYIGPKAMGSAIANSLESGELAVFERTVDAIDAATTAGRCRCVISDHAPPTVDCFELLDAVDNVPVVVTPTDGSSRLATRTLRAGAATYLDPSTLSDGATAIAATVENLGSDSADQQSVDAQLEEFSKTVSHELRNPIQKATSGIALAKTQCDSTYLDEVDSTLSQLNDLVENLLDTLETDLTVDFEPVELDAAIETAWADPPEAVLSVETDLPRIKAEPSRLYQLLENLFRNCLDHGGTDVTVRVGTVSDPPTADDQLSIYIADDGPGIDPDHREHVFEYGYTNAETGTGLGLAIVDEIADTFGWEVTITESAAGGTRVEISQIHII